MGAKRKLELADGKKITVDVSTLKVKEWRGLFDTSIPDEESDAVLARLCGLSVEEVPDMLRADLRLIFLTVIELSNSPLNDPNSPSESI